MRKSCCCMILVPLLVAASLCLAQSTGHKPKAAPSGPTHFVIPLSEVKWGAPPDGMFRGTPSVEAGSPLHYALLEGDPMKAGVPFTIRLGCSDGYKAAPHWHPTDENLVVLRGTFAMATGDKFDATGLHDLAAGTYGFMPKRVHHFGLCKGETDLLLYGVGPFVINWIGPNDPAPKRATAN